MSTGGLPPSLLRELVSRLGPGGVLTEPGRLLAYESDALPRFRQLPEAVLLPRDTGEAAWAVGRLAQAGVPLTPRGAGTGLSGGGVAAPGGVLVGTARMNRVLSLDPDRRLARVQAGVVNADLSAAAAPFGLHYAPDPSSQSACTLGGNVGENAGGPHCLKYGVTTRYVAGLTVVTGRGEVVELGGAGRCEGLDLTGIFVGSEGRMGLATELELRLIPRPRAVRTFLAVFASTEAAATAVSSIIADGLLPAAMEIMDRGTIRAVEASIYAAGYPTEAEAVLVVEFDGTDEGLDAEAERAQALCLAAGATELRRARNPAEREALWQGRKKAYGAFGRLTADLMVQDATVPRSTLPQVLRRIEEIGREHGLVVANVFHAGDGNLHPKILFDRRDPAQVERVERASKEMMRACVAAGGTITGEHGVGLDKKGYMSLVHGPRELRLMARVQRAFDPDGIWNPGKVLPEGIEGGAEERRKSDQDPPAALSHDPPDLTVSVAAEVTVAELEAALARQGQWLPLDVPGMEGRTVGEVIAEGIWGPLAPAFGRIRDLLLGAEVVPADGIPVRLGGRVMKNVAGFDLVRAVAGSRGRLGRVTRATLRLNPIPECHRVLAWEGDAAAMHALARRLATHAILPASVVRVGRTGAGTGSAPRHRVLVRLLGSRPTVEAEAAELARDLPGGTAWEGTPGAPGFVRVDPLGEAVAAEGSGLLLECRPGALSWEALEERLREALGPGSVFHHLPLWDVWRIPVRHSPGEGGDDGTPAAAPCGEALRNLAAELREGGGDLALLRGGDAGGLGEIPRPGEAWPARDLEGAVCRAFQAGDDPGDGRDGWR